MGGVAFIRNVWQLIRIGEGIFIKYVNKLLFGD